MYFYVFVILVVLAVMFLASEAQMPRLQEIPENNPSRLLPFQVAQPVVLGDVVADDGGIILFAAFLMVCKANRLQIQVFQMILTHQTSYSRNWIWIFYWTAMMVGTHHQSKPWVLQTQFLVCCYAYLFLLLLYYWLVVVPMRHVGGQSLDLVTFTHPCSKSSKYRSMQ